MQTRWHPTETDAEWLARALRFVAEAECDALARHGAFHLVLAGGGTPRRVYEALAREGHDWASWHCWFGDERCLPADHPERNSGMAREALFTHVPIPAAQVHVIAGELGNQAAAEDYARQLAGVSAFDLVLLGLGEDGHTASLFPGHAWGQTSDAPDTLAVFCAPKPPPERVSLSARRLSRAERVLFLVTGAGKRDALKQWQGGEPIPAAAIQPPAGVDVLLTSETLPLPASPTSGGGENLEGSPTRDGDANRVDSPTDVREERGSLPPHASGEGWGGEGLASETLPLPTSPTSGGEENLEAPPTSGGGANLEASPTSGGGANLEASPTLGVGNKPGA